MKNQCLAVLWLAMSTAANADDMSVGDFKANRNNPATHEYVAGVGEGMDFLNHRAEKLGREPIFCVPKNLKLNAANYMNIVDVEILRDPRKNGVLMPIVSVMVDGLIRTFPCK